MNKPNVRWLLKMPHMPKGTKPIYLVCKRGQFEEYTDEIDEALWFGSRKDAELINASLSEPHEIVTVDV